MKTIGWLVGACVVVTGANLLGWWPVTVLVGAALGLMLPLTRRAVGIGFLAGGIGWGIPLLLAGISGTAIVQLATLVGNIMMLGGVGAVVVLTLPSLIGGLLAISGAWIAGAIKQVVARPAQRSQVDAPVPLKHQPLNL